MYCATFKKRSHRAAAFWSHSELHSIRFGEKAAHSVFPPPPLFNGNIQTRVQHTSHAYASACTCWDTIVDSWQLSCEKGVRVIGWEDIKWTEELITTWTSFLQRKCSLQSCLFCLVYSLWKAFRESSDWSTLLGTTATRHVTILSGGQNQDSSGWQKCWELSEVAFHARIFTLESPWKSHLCIKLSGRKDLYTGYLFAKYTGKLTPSNVSCIPISEWTWMVHKKPNPSFLCPFSPWKVTEWWRNRPLVILLPNHCFRIIIYLFKFLLYSKQTA